MESKNPVSLRQILLKYSGVETDLADIDEAILQIKQKFAHMRRVLYFEIENNREEDGHISNDMILEIVYNEIDNVIEGNEDLNKNLKEMSKK